MAFGRGGGVLERSYRGGGEKDGDRERAVAASLLGTAGHIPAPIRTPSPSPGRSGLFGLPPLTWQKWCLLGPSAALGHSRKRCSSAVRIFSFLATLERTKRNRIFSP